MIEVTTLLGVTNPQVSRGTTAIIRDGSGNPVVIIVESSENAISIYTCDDTARFAKIAAMLGIDRVAVVDKLVLPEFVPPSGSLQI